MYMQHYTVQNNMYTCIQISCRIETISCPGVLELLYTVQQYSVCAMLYTILCLSDSALHILGNMSTHML